LIPGWELTTSCRERTGLSVDREFVQVSHPVAVVQLRICLDAYAGCELLAFVALVSTASRYRAARFPAADA